MLRLKLVLLACAAAAVSLRGPLGEANAVRRVPGARWLPDQRLAKLFSLGHRSTCADAIWLNAIGNLSRDFGDNTRKRLWLDTVFDTITRLEPTFSSVYSWGATYLGMLEADKDRAIALLEKGVAANLGDIKLSVELAMAYFEYRKDRAATLRVLERVVKDPRCDVITMGFYDSLLVDDRADFAALATFAPWLDDPHEEVKIEAELQMERAKKRIAFRAANEFETLHGRKPRSTEELRDPKLMAPEVFEPVLAAVQIDLGGRLHFPQLEQFEQKHAVRIASAWCRQFRNENGRLATQDELMHNAWTRTAPPPAGSHYVIDEAGVHVEDD